MRETETQIGNSGLVSNPDLISNHVLKGKRRRQT